MSLMTKEQYQNWINSLGSDDGDIQPQWSQPMYTCEKCGGGMCKNLWIRIKSISMPSITKYEYRCDNNECNNIEYLGG